MKIKSLILIVLLAIGYSCSDDPAPVNTGTAIIGFEATQQVAPAVIDNTAHTVTMNVKTGTDRSALAPVYALSTGATAVPASGTVRDYSKEVTINVTAQDGVTTQAWKVNVSIEPLEPSIADILAFTLADQIAAATINSVSKTVAIEVINGTNLTSLTPGITVSPGATSAPTSGTTGDYSSAVTIVVTGSDGTTTENWTVNVTEASAGGTSDATDILTFTIPDQEMPALIEFELHYIAVKMPAGTDLTNLTPAYTVSPGATAVPASGILSNLSELRWILVTAEDGTQQPWIVKVFSSYDAASICDVNDCSNDPDLAQQCITFFENCMETHGDEAFVPCALQAIGGSCD